VASSGLVRPRGSWWLGTWGHRARTREHEWYPTGCFAAFIIRVRSDVQSGSLMPSGPFVFAKRLDDMRFTEPFRSFGSRLNQSKGDIHPTCMSATRYISEKFNSQDTRINAPAYIPTRGTDKVHTIKDGQSYGSGVTLYD